MKILPLSDLHLEWGSAVPEMTFCEKDKTDTVIVLAGDIHGGVHGIQWIIDNLVGKVLAIVYVPGNHEYYGHVISDIDDLMRENIKHYGMESEIFYLNKDYVIIDDVKFIGAALWTGMNDSDKSTMITANNHMNDYNQIYTGRIVPTTYGYVRETIDASVTIALHKEHLAFIVDELRKDEDKLKVVISHHLPSYNCIRPWFRDPSRVDAISLQLNHAYASDLTSILRDEEIHLWVHGHSHAAYMEMIENAVVVSNALGYPGAYVKGFDPDMRIIVEYDDDEKG